MNKITALNCWLYGWKDIETYMGCDRKTLMYWEKEFDLPIHRPANGRPMAYPDRLKEWIESHNQIKTMNKNPKEISKIQ